MEKKVLLTELVDRGSHLRKEITPTAVVTDEGKHAAGTFWDANKTINEIVAGASSAQDTLKEVEDKLNKEIQDARAAEQAISDRIDDVLGIDAEGIADLKQAIEDLDPETGILSVIDNKTDKVDSATSGNFAALDANGNLTDSGHKHSDYITQHLDLSDYVQKSQTTGLLKNNGTVDTNIYLTQHQDISGKANISDISVITGGNANDHAYVDLGLPSGTLWATMNVGAFTEGGYGDYYQYGYTTPNQTFELYDGLEDSLDITKDAARYVWGGDWHTPTKRLWEELINNTTFSWVTITENNTSIDGCKYTGSNGNYIFLPSAGYWQYGQANNAGSRGMYLTSTPLLSSESVSGTYIFTEWKLYNIRGGVSSLAHTEGYPVRPVLDAPVPILGKTVTDAEKSAWNAKLDSSALSNYYTKTEIDQLLANL